MGKTRRFALLLGLSAVICAGPALADPASDKKVEDKSAGPANRQSPEARSDEGGKAEGDTAARRAERQLKRRERLEQGVKRLRERAAELRKKAASGETAPTPTGKRPARSFEDQARRLEEQANKMEERSKNLDKDDGAGPSRDRNSASARQRRHQVRRGHLNRRWGATLRKPEAVAELKRHAERSAKLKRIRSLALEKSKEDPAATRATELLTKEVERHEKRMNELQDKSEGASPTAPAASEDEK